MHLSRKLFFKSQHLYTLVFIEPISAILVAPIYIYGIRNFITLKNNKK